MPAQSAEPVRLYACTKCFTAVMMSDHVTLVLFGTKVAVLSGFLEPIFPMVVTFIGSRFANKSYA